MIFTNAIVWVLESEKIGARGRTTFGTGVAVPFISFFLPLAGTGLLLHWIMVSHVGLAGK